MGRDKKRVSKQDSMHEKEIRTKTKIQNPKLSIKEPNRISLTSDLCVGERGWTGSGSGRKTPALQAGGHAFDPHVWQLYCRVPQDFWQHCRQVCASVLARGYNLVKAQG